MHVRNTHTIIIGRSKILLWDSTTGMYSSTFVCIHKNQTWEKQNPYECTITGKLQENYRKFTAANMELMVVSNEWTGWTNDLAGL